MALQPTLWRTCRVLANRERLKILALFVRERELRFRLWPLGCRFPWHARAFPCARLKLDRCCGSAALAVRLPISSRTVRR